MIDTAQVAETEPEPEVGEASEPEVEVKPWERLQLEDEVFHKSLGLGTVKAISEKQIIVNFGREEMKFLFPWVFEKEYMFVMNVKA